MPTPKKRPPRSAPPGAAADPLGSGLAPAPDNGVPFAELNARKATRRGRQLGLRVPEETYERLGRVANETGISRQRLLNDALNAWLQHYEADAPD